MISLLKIAVIVAPIILLVCIIFQFIHAKKPNREVLKLREGTVGAGKTFLCVGDLVKSYRKICNGYKHRKNFFRGAFGYVSQFPPRAYSTIPLYLCRHRVKHKRKSEIYYDVMTGDLIPPDSKLLSKNKKWVEVWADVLTREHLLLEDYFPSDVVPLVLCDEIGMIACQYSYDDPNIVSENILDSYKCFETFCRFYRHYNGEGNRDECRFFMTDQTSADLVTAIRRRLGYVDFLSNFRRWLYVLPFYKIDCETMLNVEDNVQNVRAPLDDENHPEYFFGFLPYRLFTKKHYDSHAFKGTKYTGFVSRVSFENWGDNDYSFIDEKGRVWIDPFKTNYCPDLRMTATEKAFYIERKRKLRLDVRKEVNSSSGEDQGSAFLPLC